MFTQREDRREIKILPWIRIEVLGKDKPVIVGLLAQYDFSTVNYRYRRGIIQETTKMREEWFRKCLDKLAEFLSVNPVYTRIAMPCGIGCGLAGGNWEVYNTMLTQWTEKIRKVNPNIKVYLCKLT